MATPNLYEEGMQKFKKNVKDQGRVKSSKEISTYNDFLKSQKTPEEAKQACTDLSNTTHKKYDASKAGIPDAWVANIFNNIGNFIAIGDYVMKKAPETVGTAWFGISLALTAIQSNYNLYSLFGSGLTDQVEMMITIAHYDRLYDKRGTPAFKGNELLTSLFEDISDTYAAMLDFSFSIQRHITGGAGARLRHAAKDFFGAEVSKFQGKVDAIAALKAKVVEKSQGVFQSKAAERFDEVQDSVSGILASVHDIKSFQSTSEEYYKSQLLQQQEILQTLNEVKASTKQRTRWDWALQDFEAAKELLNPLKGTVKVLADRLDQRLVGSCDWIEELEEYKSWLGASSSQMLCMTGPDGVGKSILLAAIWDGIDSSVDQDSSAVLFLPCDMNVPGSTGEDSPQSLLRIANTLLCQLYEYAKIDEEHVGLLEECNNVFKNPKEQATGAQENDDQKDRAGGKFGGKLKGKKSRDERIPDLAEGLSILASILKKRVFIVLDGADRMKEEDQLELYSQLEELAKSENCYILTIIGTRSGTKLLERILSTIGNSGNVIEVEKHNRGDIELLLDAELEQIGGWTAAQRKEAKEKIVEKAGPLFKYVTQVALPFLREPFSGSLSRRLESLPGGIGETYSQFLQTMSANYVDLLRTALSFALFRIYDDVTVREVMDAFSGVYLENPSEEDLHNAESEDVSSCLAASELQLSQIRTAAGPFLDIREDEGTWLVELKDVTQVREFCFHSSSDHQNAIVNPGQLCALCKASLTLSKDIAFSERDGHLELAIRCVRHLCNPLFQKRFLRKVVEDKEDSDEDSESEGDDESMHEGPVAAVAEVKQETRQDNHEEESTDGSDADTEEGDEDDDGSEDSGSGNEDKKSEAKGEAPKAAAEKTSPMTPCDGASKVSGNWKNWKENLSKQSAKTLQAVSTITQSQDESKSIETKTTLSKQFAHVFHKANTKDVSRKEEKATIDVAQPATPPVVVTPKRKNSKHSGYDTDESKDDDDWGELRARMDESDDDSGDDSSSDDDDYVDRYEINYLSNHVQAAEALWTPDERASNPLWATLYEELDRFVNEHTHAYHVFQSIGFREDEIGDHHIADEPWKPLHMAAWLGFTGWATHLLNKGADLKDLCGGMTPLQVATYYTEGGLEMVKLLLEKVGEVPLPAEDDTYMYIFHSWIWEHPEPEGVKLFYEYKVRRDIVDKFNGWSLMHYFAESGEDTKAFDLLMEKDGPGAPPDINAITADKAKETPLHILLKRRDVPIPILTKFIEHGADVDRDDASSKRSLHMAAAWGDEKVLNVLLPKVSDINDEDKHGRTALHDAAFYGHESSVRILLEHGADIQALDHHSRTPLFSACLSKSSATATLLLEKLLERSFSVFDINKATKRGRTPLRQGAAHGFTDVVKKLLELLKERLGAHAEAAINKIDDLKRRSALHCAALHGHIDCVRLLLEAQADATLKDADGRTALQLCYPHWPLTGSSAREDIIDLLIDADSTAAAPDTELVSAAAVNDSRRILEKLHGYGADLKRPDQFGWTPLMLAQELGNASAEEYLTQQDTWFGALPSKWIDIPPDVEDQNNDGLRLRYKAGKRRFCISSDRPVPPGLPKYYFEVTLQKMEELEDRRAVELAIGFATAQAAFIIFPGWIASPRAPSARSWAYHGDDGGFGRSVGEEFIENAAPKFGDNDTVGCGIDVRTSKMWLTLNGKVVEQDFFNDVKGRLFPLVGVRQAVEFVTNFGSQPFMWKGAGVVVPNDANGDQQQTGHLERSMTV